MIYSLRGPLLRAEPGLAVIECGGVGYRCMISLTTLSQLPPRGDEVFLLIHMAVREDSVDLFGFADERELDCFRLLTGVNGVGARLAMALLSDLTSDRLSLAVASGDVRTLTRTTGVGSKLAQRIVLELKDKLSPFGGDPEAAQSIAAGTASAGPMGEATAALVALGYSQSDAAAALAPHGAEQSVEALIKTGLKALSKRTY